MDIDGDLGLTYHRWSCWSAADYEGSFPRPASWGIRPSREDRLRGTPSVDLPREMAKGQLRLDEAVERRRSIRHYSDRPLPIPVLARLLYVAAGITDPIKGYRAAPSAGRTFPLEVYAVVNRVVDVAPGAYRYVPERHALDLVREGDLRQETLTACLDQEMVEQAAVNLVLTAVFQRTRWKYGPRAYRYVLMEAGHVAQNVYLAATSLGLGSCAIAAFADDQVNALVGADGSAEAALYLMSVGSLA